MAAKCVSFTTESTESTAPLSLFDSSESDDDFCEITTSEGESLATFDEEDAELLEMALDGAYSYNPSLFSKCTLDPAERSSLLLLDKDILESEGM